MKFFSTFILAFIFFTSMTAKAVVTPAYSNLVGSLNYAPTASCNWSGASTSWAVFAADTDCPTPTVSGCASAPGTKIPGVVCTVKKGTYLVVVNGFFQPASSTVSAVMAWRISDGTLNSGLVQARSTGVINAGIGANSGGSGPIVGVFTYTAATAGSKTFQVQQYTSSGSNAAQIAAASSSDYQYMGLDIKIFYFPPASP